MTQLSLFDDEPRLRAMSAAELRLAALFGERRLAEDWADSVERLAIGRDRDGQLLTRDEFLQEALGETEALEFLVSQIESVLTDH